MIKLPFLALLLTFGNHSIGNNKSNRSEKYIDIDEIPKANIDYTPVFQHKTPDRARKGDTLKYERNVFSTYNWIGKEDEPLGSFNVYSLSLYVYNKALFKVDSIYMHSPIHVSKDSNRFLFTCFHSIDGEETPYGNILFADIQTKKTFLIEAFKPVSGPFIDNDHSFIFAEDNTVYSYDITAKKKRAIFHMVSAKPFTIINLKLLDDHKTLRIMFLNDESKDNTCTAMDIDIGTSASHAKKE